MILFEKLDKPIAIYFPASSLILVHPTSEPVPSNQPKFYNHLVDILGSRSHLIERPIQDIIIRGTFFIAFLRGLGFYDIIANFESRRLNAKVFLHSIKVRKPY